MPGGNPSSRTTARRRSSSSPLQLHHQRTPSHRNFIPLGPPGTFLDSGAHHQAPPQSSRLRTSIRTHLSRGGAAGGGGGRAARGRPQAAGHGRQGRVRLALVGRGADGHAEAVADADDPVAPGPGGGPDLQEQLAVASGSSAEIVGRECNQAVGLCFFVVPSLPPPGGGERGDEISLWNAGTAFSGPLIFPHSGPSCGPAPAARIRPMAVQHLLFQAGRRRSRAAAASTGRPAAASLVGGALPSPGTSEHGVAQLGDPRFSGGPPRGCPGSPPRRAGSRGPPGSGCGARGRCPPGMPWERVRPRPPEADLRLPADPGRPAWRPLPAPPPCRSAPSRRPTGGPPRRRVPWGHLLVASPPGVPPGPSPPLSDGRCSPSLPGWPRRPCETLPLEARRAGTIRWPRGGPGAPPAPRAAGGASRGRGPPHGLRPHSPPPGRGGPFPPRARTRRTVRRAPRPGRGPAQDQGGCVRDPPGDPGPRAGPGCGGRRPGREGAGRAGPPRWPGSAGGRWPAAGPGFLQEVAVRASTDGGSSFHQRRRVRHRLLQVLQEQVLHPLAGEGGRGLVTICRLRCPEGGSLPGSPGPRPGPARGRCKWASRSCWPSRGGQAPRLGGACGDAQVPDLDRAVLVDH